MAINYTRDKKRDKEVIRLREQVKLTFPQIAVELGVSTPRARQLYVRLVKERDNEKMK